MALNGQEIVDNISAEPRATVVFFEIFISTSYHGFAFKKVYYVARIDNLPVCRYLLV